MADEPTRDIPAPGTGPATQDGSRLAVGGAGREGHEVSDAAIVAAGEQNGQRPRRIDCSPGEERDRPSSDGHGRHR